MKISISSNKNYISIPFYKIDFEKVKKLLEYLNIDSVSILRYEVNKYTFDNNILISDFIDYISNVNSSTIIFDGKVECCLIDKEIDTLISRKILVDYNLDENMTYILINIYNAIITKEEVIKIFN